MDGTTPLSTPASSGKLLSKRDGDLVAEPSLNRSLGPYNMSQ